jgi:anti-sigma factor RsiW
MTITRDIISDLLPAYLSGEASADTRALIEEMAARDPDIARLVASAQDERTDTMFTHTVSLPPNLERDVVTRTRAILRRRSWTLALALFFTFVPLVFAFHDGVVTFFMLRDEPGSRLLWVSALYLWFDYVRQSRRLRTKLPA